MFIASLNVWNCAQTSYSRVIPIGIIDKLKTQMSVSSYKNNIFDINNIVYTHHAREPLYSKNAVAACCTS